MPLFSRKPKAVDPVVVSKSGFSPGPGGPSGGPSGGQLGMGAAQGDGAGAKAGAGVGGALEGRIRELGSEFLRRARGHRSGVLSAKFYSDAMMEWSMKDQAFKVQTFRFVDAFPMLKTPEAIYDHLQDYLSQPGVTVPGAISAMLKAGQLAKGLSAGMISKQITGMASKFIAGTDAASALPGLAAMWKEGIAFSVDLLGETCVSEEEADGYAKKYLDLVGNLPGLVAGWSGNERLETDHLGPIPRTNVSIKISALSSRVDPIDTEGSIRGLMVRLVPILELAKQRGVFINFDMEHHALKDLTLELFERCCEAVDFEGGLAMQAYLRSGEEDARRIVAWAKGAKKVVTVRLVKGAYWDAETIKAEMHGWPCPVWATKRETDACFERMTAILLDGTARGESGGVKLALGSHNARSIAACLAGMEARGLPRSAVELQMLHGMADQLKHAAAEMGLRVREYVPVGEMIPGMAYLVRRLLENTSNESWLKAGFLDNADEGRLLASPHGPAGKGAGAEGVTGDAATIKTAEPSAMNVSRAAERHGLSAGVAEMGLSPFVTEPMRDFAEKGTREAFASAVMRAAVPSVANDTTPTAAGEMVARAERAFVGWRGVDVAERARVLLLAAGSMRARRDELAGMMIKEAGKTWREADADVCEAIDFCEYYAREAVALMRPRRLGRFVGELNESFGEPRGVAVVISPWNFPLAICCGMVVAALVTGNTVVVKPAEQTPGIAKVMVEILREAIERAAREGAGKEPAGRGGWGGLLAEHRREVVQFCPGPGETVGAGLVRDPRVALIAFTGSRDVGCDILHAAAPMSPFAGDRGGFQAWATRPGATIKRVICEMGGKNAIIVDTSADFDEAVLGVRQSAFGFQGQKCSACSRCIVVDPDGPAGPAITAFSRRLIEATRALVIGDPTKPGTDVGPVIDAEAKAKIMGFIERARGSGLSGLAMEVPAGLEGATGRAYVGPHVFLNVPPTHELAREEIFGPVLAVLHAGSFEEALRLANDAAYKLTGGVFSRKPSHIERARREFRVGNLYINRGITGALVGRQPFGGFGMSGVGSKAGGAEYLRQFVDPRAICENTMRRGFAPEL